jgi:hypothetical protein
MVFLLVGILLLNMVSIKLKLIQSVILSAVIVLMSFNNLYSFKAVKYDPPYHRYKNLSEKIVDLNLELELIINHMAFAEYFTFHTGIDALPWIPEYAINSRKLWRVATSLTSKLIQTNLRKEDLNLYNELRTWKNLYEIRPQYLMKNKKN